VADGVGVTPLDPFDQSGFRVRFDWGAMGLARLAPSADVVVIVDVLRFTTCVDVALAQGATVLPYRWNDEGQVAFAAQHRAVLADSSPGAKGKAWSLSPTELSAIPAGTRLVLPSPNGAALAFAAAEAEAASVMAACLRNAASVAECISAGPDGGGIVAVIAAGEGWGGAGGPLRAGIEDLLGAGAVIAALGDESVSPEAGIARSAWFAHRHDLPNVLVRCGSGRELAAKGFGPDVLVAAEANVSTVAPILEGPAFVDARSTPM
jgi:2-phosphosulfolactate phosphatase